MTRSASQYLSDLERRADLACSSSHQDALLSDLAASQPVSQPADAQPSTAPRIMPLDGVGFALRFPQSRQIAAIRRALAVDDTVYGSLLADAINFVGAQTGATSIEAIDFALVQATVDGFLIDLFNELTGSGSDNANGEADHA